MENVSYRYLRREIRKRTTGRGNLTRRCCEIAMYSGERVASYVFRAAQSAQLAACIKTEILSILRMELETDTARKFQLCDAARRGAAVIVVHVYIYRTHRCWIRPSFSTALRFVLRKSLVEKRETLSTESVNVCRVVVEECAMEFAISTKNPTRLRNEFFSRNGKPLVRNLRYASIAK